MEAFALSPDAPRLALPARLLSDDRLLRLVAAGNPQAFGAVYARYHAPLYAYCRSIVRDPDDARDALQNTMLKALAALGRGQDREISLKPWLFRIAHNESISLLRRRRPSEPLTDAVSPPVPGVDREVIARERLGQLVEDLGELPERQRSALIMREVNGLSYEDIASALTISEGAARQTVFAARSTLAEYGEGREVACENIRRSISDGDGRALRARGVRAHLRSCNACRDFQSTLRVRRRDLALLAPGLSGGAAMGLLQAVLGTGTVGGAATGGAGLLGGSTAALFASGAAKGVVALVAVTAAGAGAAHIAAAPDRHHQHTSTSAIAPAVRVAVPVAHTGLTESLRRLTTSAGHSQRTVSTTTSSKQHSSTGSQDTGSSSGSGQGATDWSEGQRDRPARRQQGDGQGYGQDDGSSQQQQAPPAADTTGTDGSSDSGSVLATGDDSGAADGQSAQWAPRQSGMRQQQAAPPPVLEGSDGSSSGDSADAPPPPQFGTYANAG